MDTEGNMMFRRLQCRHITGRMVPDITFRRPLTLLITADIGRAAQVIAENVKFSGGFLK